MNFAEGQLTVEFQVNFSTYQKYHIQFIQGPTSQESQALKLAGAAIELYPEIVGVSEDTDTEIQISEVMVADSEIKSKTFINLAKDEEYIVRINTIIDGKVISSVAQIIKQ